MNFLTSGLRCLFLATLAVGVGSVSATCAVADTISVDEQGNISINASPGTMGVLGTDPDTHMQVLVYSLPFLGNPGEVELTAAGSVSDIIRFPGNGTLEYYSVIAKPTTLAAATVVGATNIKVTSNSGYGAGDPIDIDTGASQEKGAIVSVGTFGATGTGITLAVPLMLAHASGSSITDTEPLELADLISDPFVGLSGQTVHLLEVAGGTLWRPGTNGIGGDTTSPEYDFGAAITPLPSALPLFAGGLGILGLLGWRRKQEAEAGGRLTKSTQTRNILRSAVLCFPDERPPGSHPAAL